MDSEILPGGDGLYAVCFKNFKERSEEEIKDVFSRFGNVVSVRFAGPDKSGMAFVRYREYEETKNCLEELRKTKEFSVRMAVNKNANTNLNGSRHSLPNSNSINRNRKDSNNFRRSFNPRENDNIRDKDTNEKFNENKVFRKPSITEKEIPALEEMPDLEDEVPPLEDTSDMPGLEEGEPEIKPVDITLANFPPETEAVDLLYLLRDLHINAVCISDIETTDTKHVPFCHVWLGDVSEADVAERKLHGYIYAGKKLLAVKTQTLLED